MDMTYKIIRFFWIGLASAILVVCLVFFLIAKGWLGFMPSFEDLENPQRNLATEVYSEDGQLMCTFYVENRVSVGFEELSPNLVNALIAREDHRFYDHSGIDGIGLIRVAVKTLLLRQSSEGGGSTITQQLAKNLFPRDTSQNRFPMQRFTKLVLAKFREWVTAVKLERNYTKQEIIAMYLSTIEFGHGAFGVKSASRTFFNKTPDMLNVEEAALLVGMLNKPTRYSPVNHPDLSLIRRNGVLRKMEERGFLAEKKCDSLVQLPIVLNFSLQDNNAGTGTYFREYLRLIMNKKKPALSKYMNPVSYREDSLQWFTNPLFGWCNKNIKPDGHPYNLYTDGLKIYTTINFRMQKYAEEAMAEHMKHQQSVFFRVKKGVRNAPYAEDITDEEVARSLERAMVQSSRYIEMKGDGASREEIVRAFHTPVMMKVFSWNGERDTLMTPFDSLVYYKHFLRGSLMSMDPHTGYVRAYVGGIDFKYFKWDGVMVQKRQVGSTFKPFLYTLAMQEGLSPCFKVLNVEQAFTVGDDIWVPGSSGPKDFLNKEVTLKWGLANSENNITAWLLKRFTPQAVAQMAHRMGITSRIDPVPSIVLGTPEISLAEMVGAYSVFANKGIYTQPVMVTRIEDKSGSVLANHFVPHTDEVLSERTAYLMISLLQAVVREGTGRRLRGMYGLLNEIGGKTGTTQNHADGWFMGVTPDLVTGVWVGGEENSIHFDAMEDGQGARMAMPIFALFMQKVYRDANINLTQAPFEAPDGMSSYINCDDDAQSAQRSIIQNEEVF